MKQALKSVNRSARISVIIPVLNEERNLARLLPGLRDGAAEIIVADGGSSDSSLAVAGRFSAKVVRSGPGRALQMNRGAEESTGDILWFLHADSQIPPDWKERILWACSDADTVGGGFRVVIDSPGWRYRFLDLWGWGRTLLQKTFYGDQGLFVRREAFRRLSGFSSAPFLEDLDFSVRMKRAGRVQPLSEPILTSARRWEEYGFWKTVSHHSRLVLFHTFARPRAHAPIPLPIVIVAKAPLPGKVKTRLVPPLTFEEAADLAKRLLEETVATVRSLPGVEPILAVASAEEVEIVRPLVPKDVQVTVQSAGDLGERLAELFQRRLVGKAAAGARGSATTRLGAAAGVIILGADHPGLPAPYLQRAVRELRTGNDCVVLGPTEDGGYYLIGLNRPHPELFQAIPWGTGDVLALTLQRARQAKVPVVLLPKWYDLDRPEDLRRYRMERQTIR